MVGRWKSGAPLELAPLRDNAALGADENRNNDFEFGDDPFQRKCPYATHIRKVYPRDDTGNEAEVQRHRIIRAGIPFGPEVEPGETTTRHSRGLMFVCYQTSIERQFCLSSAVIRTIRILSAARRVLEGVPLGPGSIRSSGRLLAEALARWTSPIQTNPLGTGARRWKCLANS
jgi:hypothetical protein